MRDVAARFPASITNEDPILRARKVAAKMREIQDERWEEEFTMMTLKLLKEMCEGHYRDIQDYLRNQKGKSKTYNLVEEICQFALFIDRYVDIYFPIDPETGLRASAPTATVYSGKCKVQTYEPHESARASGDHVYTEQRYHLHLPIGAGPIEVDDEALITAAFADSELVGKTYRIAGLHSKTFATAQRLLVDEITD